MFGYVTANKKDLSAEQEARYKAAYCGVCAELSKRGAAARLALSYDMAFLVLLLDSLYEPEIKELRARCAMHPISPCRRDESEFTAYAAGMNAALAYYKCLDDYADDGNILRRAEAGLLKKSFDEARERWPRQARAMASSMEGLRELEKGGLEAPGPSSLDAAANCFGEIMAELFAPFEDNWAGRLRQTGRSLGRFIYVMDAFEDCEADIKKGRYNPLKGRFREEGFSEYCRSALNILMGECAESFEKLPLVQDIELMRNIIYSGVWSRWEMKLARDAAKKRRRAVD